MATLIIDKIKGGSGGVELSIPTTDGSLGQLIKTDGNGNLSWTTDTNTTYSVGDGGLTTNDLTNTLKANYDTGYSHSQAGHAPSGAEANAANTAITTAANSWTATQTFGDELLVGAKIKDYSEAYTATSGTGTQALDLTLGNVFKHTASGGNVTFTFTNPPTSGAAGSFTLIWVQDTTDRTITWPVSVDWAGGTAPDVTSGSGKVDVYTFFTVDGGTLWYGMQAGADFT